VSTVLILSAQRVTQGTGNVWGAAVNVDSATRRIVAANDSIARQAAILEARARQAVVDSVRRATIDSFRRSLGMLGVPAVTDNAAGVAASPSATRPVVPRRDSIRPDSSRRPPP